MRLKKLEIYGFKSFADRVEMIFPDGVTGVVGPNGSGKSNIGDAVRWVLGEQSAKTLRGAKMEDVIFGGTEKRKAQAYCEVSLVFDNSDGKLPVDYAEVMITRRVYRSGDSEYYLNKSPCRLRDIIDLMRDTGIGKEGYSLIGQGRIDEILSVKSEERRNVFEEAAGITKYKARKAEAERRMENTAENLSRVEDILNEVGARLPELEKQAGNAREYMKLTDELRRAMGVAAIKAVRAVDYKNAGTIEFLLDTTGKFYFMEMNTRVQVEHPVSEQITGTDIIKEQLRIAAGEPMSCADRAPFTPFGHAMEFRINAEDPDHGFRPCPGKITRFEPPMGPGVRVETYVHEGSSISPYYDSMVAKVIVSGQDREECLARGRRALDEFKIEGIATTLPFHRRVLDNEVFRAGEATTDFIETQMGDLL